MDNEDITITEDNVEDFKIFCFLSQGNPGACNILMNLITPFYISNADFQQAT